MLASTANIVQSVLSRIDQTPSLRLRKDIWTHFPVCLVKLPTAEDGRDRYAIQWHQKNLTEWSQGIPQYPVITHVRLLKALKASERWTVEKPATPGDLCVIVVNVQTLTSKSEDLTVDLPRLFDTLPEHITSVERLRTYFPICWKSKNNRYTLEFHNTCVRALAAQQGLTEFEVKTLTVRKLQTVLASNWEVQKTHKVLGNEICTIWKKQPIDLM